MLERLWLVQTFRESFTQFLELDEQRQRDLIRFLRGEEIVGDPLSDSEIKVANVARTFMQLQDRVGLSELLGEIERLPADTLSLRGVVADELLSREDSSNPYFDLQRSVLPFAEHVALNVDFRAAEDEEGAFLGLVPITTIRISLDEPLGGSKALVVQLPDGALKQLRSELDRADKLLGTVSNAAKDLVLKDPTDGV